MIDDIVIVKACGNKPLVRQMIQVTPRSVFILDEANYLKRIANQDAHEAVGFQRRTVFCRDEKLLLGVGMQYGKNPEVWNRLKVYEGSAEQNG